jgi:hypothetical protein
MPTQGSDRRGLRGPAPYG